MRNFRYLACGIVLSGLFIGAAPQPASAQENVVGGADTPEIIEKLFNCRKIEDPAARLNCFDREVAAVEQAEESNELVIADREGMKEARRGLFGFNLPKIKLFGGDEKGVGDVDQIEAVISSVRRAGNGKMLFVLDNGARWIQTDGTRIPPSVDEGDTITIKRAALGSHMAKVGRNRAFRIKRLN